jgi:hypothetical protein
MAPTRENIMEEFKYDTYCGLYCGACDIMSAFKRAVERNENAKWEDIAPDLRKNIPKPKTDAIVCYGCKSDTVFAGCSKCLIRKCAKTKMHVETCFQCTRFPCARFRIFSLIRKLMQRRLPHLRSMYANQACIQDKGIAAWLSEQQERWKCPNCATPFTWYGKVCTSCGSDLDFQRRFSG